MKRIARYKIIVDRLLAGATRAEIVAAIQIVYPDLSDKKIRKQIATCYPILRKQGYDIVKNGDIVKAVKVSEEK